MAWDEQVETKCHEMNKLRQNGMRRWNEGWNNKEQAREDKMQWKINHSESNVKPKLHHGKLKVNNDLCIW